VTFCSGFSDNNSSNITKSTPVLMMEVMLKHIKPERLIDRMQ